MRFVLLWRCVLLCVVVCPSSVTAKLSELRWVYAEKDFDEKSDYYACIVCVNCLYEALEPILRGAYKVTQTAVVGPSPDRWRMHRDMLKKDKKLFGGHICDHSGGSIFPYCDMGLEFEYLARCYPFVPLFQESHRTSFINNTFRAVAAAGQRDLRNIESDTLYKAFNQYTRNNREYLSRLPRAPRVHSPARAAASAALQHQQQAPSAAPAATHVSAPTHRNSAAYTGGGAGGAGGAVGVNRTLALCKLRRLCMLCMILFLCCVAICCLCFPVCVRVIVVCFGCVLSGCG